MKSQKATYAIPYNKDDTTFKYDGLMPSDNGQGVRISHYEFQIWALIAILLYVVALPRAINLGRFNFLLDHSAIILLVVSTTVVICYFLLFIKKILVYLTPMSFLPYLIRQHDKDNSKEQNNYVSFRAVSDILILSIRKEDQILATTITDFMYRQFRSIRDQSKGQAVEYPNAFYKIIYDTIGELAVSNSRKVSFGIDGAAGSSWMLGELQATSISNVTYSWMWQNLKLCLLYNKEDFVVRHWQNAHQFMGTQLSRLPPQLDFETGDRLNDAAIVARDSERRLFFEFHLALGALILHQRRCLLLRRLFRYTQSSPPRFELLPSTMSEIFYDYFRYTDVFNVTPLDIRFPFPNAEGVGADDEINSAIRNYLALLYIRQFTLQKFYVYEDPLAMPNVPVSQREKKKWIDNIQLLELQVEALLKDKELMNAVDFGHLTDEWFQQRNIVHPLTWIRTFKEALENAFVQTENEQQVSNEKVEAFKEAARKIVIPVMDDTATLFSVSTAATGESKRFYIGGELQLFDKADFAVDQPAEHINFDTFLASRLAQKIPAAVSQSFVVITRKYFLLQPDEIPSALSKMKFNPEVDVIVCCSARILQRLRSVKGSWNETSIIELTGSNFQIVGDSIFVCKRDDLPKIEFLDINSDWKEQYKLEKLSLGHHLYGSVIDLFRESQLLQAVSETNNGADLQKKVAVSLFINGQITWKTASQVVQIEAFSPYGRKGIPQNLSDIETF
jgi:flagellar hook-basal body complex protein FliE